MRKSIRTISESPDNALVQKIKSLEKILNKVEELDNSITDFEDKFEQDKKLAKDVINVKNYVKRLISIEKENAKKSGAGLNY